MKKLSKMLVIMVFLLLLINITGCNFNNSSKERLEKAKKENQQLEKQDKIKREDDLKKIKEKKFKQQKEEEKNKKVQENKNSNVKVKVVSSFETPLINRSNERINNINIALKKVNNYVIKPNNIFSFNKIVGERNSKNGYKKAPIIDHGKDKSGYGGGICQLSSTIYNSAVKSGMKILERHKHSKQVHYVSKGMDAAVNYGDKDLKFKNIKPYNIKITGKIVSNKLVVTMLKE